MFVNLVHFPPIKNGKDSEFLEWFARSNSQLATQNGFIRRLLLKPRGGGDYVAVVETQSLEAFKEMQASPLHAKVHAGVEQFLDGDPVPRFYDVIVE